jgi:signal peptidase I
VDDFRADIVPDIQVPGEARSGVSHFLLDIVETILLAAVLFLAINAVSARIRVEGSSMEPTLHNDEFVIVNKLAYKFGKMTRGDIVVFHFPRDRHQDYIKRIIGLPGDKVDITNGQVYINGQKILEPYIAASPAYSGSWTVPENAIFVLGDNRNHSSDSHNWEYVSLNDVVGKALVVYWPPSAWEIIQHIPLVAVAP